MDKFVKAFWIKADDPANLPGNMVGRPVPSVGVGSTGTPKPNVDVKPAYKENEERNKQEEIERNKPTAEQAQKNILDKLVESGQIIIAHKGYNDIYRGRIISVEETKRPAEPFKLTIEYFDPEHPETLQKTEDRASYFFYVQKTWKEKGNWKIEGDSEKTKFTATNLL